MDYIYSLMAEIEVSLFYLKYLKNKKISEVHIAFIYRHTLQNLKYLIGEMSEDEIVYEILHYSNIKQEDKKILNELKPTYELDKINEIRKFERKIKKNYDFKEIISELIIFIQEIKYKYKLKYNLKLNRNENFNNYIISHILGNYAQYKEKNFIGTFIFSDDNDDFKKIYDEKSLKEKEKYFKKYLKIFLIVFNHFLKRSDMLNKKNIEKKISEFYFQKNINWEIFDNLYLEIPVDGFSKKNFFRKKSLKINNYSDQIKLNKNIITRKEELDFILGKHSNIKIMETDSFFLKYQNEYILRQDKQITYVLKDLIQGQIFDSILHTKENKVKIIELNEIDLRKNAHHKKTSYLVRNGVWGVFYNSSSWILFDNIFSRYENIEKYILKDSFRDQVLEKFSDYIDFQKYKIKSNIYDDFLKMKSCFYDEIYKNKYLVDTTKGFLFELIVLNYFLKNDLKKIKKYELSKEIEFEKEKTEIDILLELENNYIFLIQVKSTFSYNNYNEILKHFSICENFIKNKKEKQVKIKKYLIFNEIRESHIDYHEDIKEKIKKPLEDINFLSFEKIIETEKNSFLKKRILNIFNKM